MEKEKLLPCPFCGSEAHPVECDQDNHYWSPWVIYCSKCYAELSRKKPEKTIKAWNKRTSNWKPIKSAPKDGTEILACTEVFDYRPYFVSWYKRPKCLRRGFEYFARRGTFERFPATLWTPLPDPPEKKQTNPDVQG